MSLDSCARLHLDQQRRFNSYFTLGCVGVVAGLVLVIAAGSLRDVSTHTLLAVAITPVPTLLVTIKLRHILVGDDSIVLYEQFLSVLATTALVLHLAGEPLWPGLELVTLGVGAFLVFGRIGCTMVGCCHGRAATRGIRYGRDHAEYMPRYYIGVPLVPVQPFESVCTAVLVAIGVAVVLADHTPGEVVALYFGSYGLLRFGLELRRGDATRPFALGLSEAQWIAVILGWAVAAVALARALTLAYVWLGAAVVLSAAAVVVMLVSRRPGHPWTLNNPRRLRELADTVRQLEAQTGAGPAVATTPAGLRISRSQTAEQIHFGISLVDGDLDARAAEVLARQLALVSGANATPSTQPGKAPGLFHVFVAAPAGAA